MGKRELLLIFGFVVLGVVVYQATAPPPGPGEQGFSLSRIFDNIRREMRAHSASVRLVNPVAHAVAADITELRLDPRSREITITGGETDAIAGELSVHSTGADEPEAKQLASETVVEFEQTGNILFARVHYPEGGRQTTGLTLTVPARLRVRLSPNSGKLTATNLAGLELDQARGETVVEDIAGAATLQHRGGELRVARVGSLELTTRGSTVRVEGVKGAAVFTVQAGELTASALGGSVHLESTSAQVTLDGLEKTTGSVRATASAGEITIRGLASDAQIEARSADVDLAIHAPAVITVISEGGGVRVAPPAGSYRLAAESRAGKISIDPPGLLAPLESEASEDAAGQRLRGDVGGGGPLLSIRARGDITFARE